MPYDVEVKVRSVRGSCFFGHKVGDTTYFDGKTIKGNICYSALMMLLPKIYSMKYGAEFCWAENRDPLSNACPDPDNPVVFQIRRIRK
jgi:uncharacterized repeat protein (TIGR04076 family)